jgi:hypothetical protein
MESDSEISSYDGDEEGASTEGKYSKVTSTAKSDSSRPMKRRKKSKSSAGKSFTYEGRTRKKENEKKIQKKEEEKSNIYCEEVPNLNQYQQNARQPDMGLPHIITDSTDEVFGELL